VSPGAQRGVALVVLLAAGIVSLPVAAYFLDGESTENWIVPVQLVAMALIGAAVGRLLPGLTGADATAVRAALVGAVAGVVMALVGVVIFFLLLSGFEGA
jgi:hypothetical protein